MSRYKSFTGELKHISEKEIVLQTEDSEVYFNVNKLNNQKTFPDGLKEGESLEIRVKKEPRVFITSQGIGLTYVHVADLYKLTKKNGITSGTYICELKLDGWSYGN